MADGSYVRCQMFNRVEQRSYARCFCKGIWHFPVQIPPLKPGQRGTVKVDAARRRGGIKIVWLAWFMDSVALWERQDETHYFLDEPSTSTAPAPAPVSSPTGSSQQVSSEPEPDTDEWDAEPAEAPGTLELNEINWNDINDEVEAAMNESDDEENVSKKGASEDEWTDESNSVIRCVERLVQACYVADLHQRTHNYSTIEAKETEERDTVGNREWEERERCECR